MVCSEYVVARSRHLEIRANRDFKPFSTWLEEKVEDLLATTGNVPFNVMLLRQQPSTRVAEFPMMYAYGSHYRCEDRLLGGTHVSYDSGVASIINQVCMSSRSDRNPVEAQLRYVGVLRKIIRVQYASFKVNIMKCQWIKPNLVGRPTMRKDEHGFWLVKEGVYQGEDDEPYILSTHASQVCSSTTNSL